jgi:ethanolamine permease
MADTDITAAGGIDGIAGRGTKVGLLRVLGPAHVWALGVGIVLVGEYMGWNFAVGKGGAYAALIACWFAGILYSCVAMIDSEVTSTVASAGGQYTQAKHIIASLWFHFWRYRFVQRAAQFTMPWPKPRGY